MKESERAKKRLNMCVSLCVSVCIAIKLHSICFVDTLLTRDVIPPSGLFVQVSFLHVVAEQLARGMRPSNFTGLNKDWQEWNFKLEKYMAATSSKIARDIDTAEMLKTPITIDGVNHTTIMNSRLTATVHCDASMVRPVWRPGAVRTPGRCVNARNHPFA